MSEIEETAEILSQSKRTKDLVRKWRGQITWLTKVPLGVVYTYKKWDKYKKEFVSGTERPRLDVKRGVALPGMLKAVLGDIVDENGKLRFPVTVVHLKNEQDPDPESDSEYRTEIGMNVLVAIWENGWLTLNGKHMLPKEVVKVLSKTLPTAADFAAYARRFCAPLMGNGLHKNHEFIVKDILSKNRAGNIIHAGSDGNGLIHQDHPIMVAIFGANSRKYPIQVTGWHPWQGVMFKGILVPDPRCVDENGIPIIWFDWSMVKGAHKEYAAVMSGKNRGAFDSNGVLVDPEKLIELKRSEGFYIGVLQTWCKPSLMSSCFENLQVLEDTEKNRTTCINRVTSSLDEMTLGGGLHGILERMAEDKPNVGI